MNAMPAKLVRITELLANAPIDPEAHLDTARVEHYAQVFDALPPVIVFDTAEEGLLLADGYHRLAAARRRGLEMVEAEVRLGSRHDALQYAATVGAAQRGISTEARPRRPPPTSGAVAKASGLKRRLSRTQTSENLSSAKLVNSPSP